MNAASSAHESHFGPSSEPINVGEFLQEACCSLSSTSSLFDDVLSIMEECSVDDLKSSLSETLSNPRLAAHAKKFHDTTVATIYEAADPNVSNRRKRKRDAAPSTTQEVPEVLKFQKTLDNIRLQSWPLTQDAASFMRGPKTSDLNALSAVKSLGCGFSSTHTAILTITVHNRVSWSHNYVSRFSQHTILSSQTLGDLFEAIPCPSNELPREIIEDGDMAGYKPPIDGAPPVTSGCVVCIEDVLHGDGLSEEDYADKLISHLSSHGRHLKKGPPMHEMTFSSLILRLNEPYWLLHQGNCEHFLVLEQIRLVQDDDPKAGYPLTTQITPPSLDTCKACTKVPAVYSIVGDVRLGESPCLLCAPCWRNMGLPKADDASHVLVVQLPRHEHGW